MERRVQRTGTPRDRDPGARLRWKFPCAALILSVAALACGKARAEELPACGNAPGEVRLRLSFSGLHSAAGSVVITVYPDDAKRFLAKGGKLLRTQVTAALPVATACLVMPATGFYAISVYHDEDDNHHLDKNFLGLPTEGGGFSNNPRLRFGWPSFTDVRFAALPGDNRLEIHINY
jgi:uncharacterized protein (DUF2141 family)